MIYLQLFIEFFKTGLFAIGGGLATIPFLHDMSNRTGWFSLDDIANMIAVSQSTPGPLGINMAAYVGYLTGGVLGTIIAPLGLIMPSFIIIILIANVLQKFSESEWVKGIFYGLKPASLALITIAWFHVISITYYPLGLVGQGKQDFFWQGMILAGILWIIIRKWKIHPLFIIVMAGIIGIIFRF